MVAMFPCKIKRCFTDGNCKFYNIINRVLEIVIFSAILTKLNNPMTIKINMKCKCHKRKEIFKFLGRKVYRFSFDRRRERYGKDGFDKLDKKNHDEEKNIWCDNQESINIRFIFQELNINFDINRSRMNPVNCICISPANHATLFSNTKRMPTKRNTAFNYFST